MSLQNQKRKNSKSLPTAAFEKPISKIIKVVRDIKNTGQVCHEMPVAILNDFKELMRLKRRKLGTINMSLQNQMRKNTISLPTAASAKVISRKIISSRSSITVGIRK